MNVGTSHLSNSRVPVKRQPCGGVSNGHVRSRSTNSFIPRRLPSVARGHHATILQSPPIIAGLPSAVAWSHPTVEGVPSIAEGSQPAIAWVHSDVAWVHATILWLHSVIARSRSIVARRLAMAERRQSALIHAIFAKNSRFYLFNAKTQRSRDAESDVSLASRLCIKPENRSGMGSARAARAVFRALAENIEFRERFRRFRAVSRARCWTRGVSSCTRWRVRSPIPVSGLNS